MSSVLNDIQKWYASNCDGNWEHSFGVQIGTLDNPGWDVTIDLEATNLENKHFEILQNDVSDKRWILCHVENKKFRGFGDETKLEEIIKVFLDWAELEGKD